MKKKITIPEDEYNNPAGGWDKWKTWKMQEVEIAGKKTWAWIVGDAIVTKWGHDFEKQVYEIEYFEK